MKQWIKQFTAKISLRKLAVSSVGILTLMSIFAFATFEVTKSEVTVEADNELLSVFTHATTVEELLEEQNIEFGVHDYIEPSPDTAITEAMNIVYKPAQQIVVNLEGEEEPVWTIASTVGDLMDELEVEVKEHDLIEPSLGTKLDVDTNVTFESAFQVVLHSDGEQEKMWTTSTTVADLLDRENISLDGLDRVEPARNKDLIEDAEVSVIRVEKVTDVVKEEIDYGTVTRNDSSLAQGSEDVKQEGQIGKVKKFYEVIIENGEEISRELIEEDLVQESKDRIVAVGTRAPTPTVSRGGAPSSSASGGSWRTFRSTAYTAYCNGCSGTTRTGVDLRANPNANVIAVDPNVIPLGSYVEVKGMGTFLAADTGGAIKGNKIDIFIPDRSQALSYGRRSVEIRVLD